MAQAQQEIGAIRAAPPHFRAEQAHSPGQTYFRHQALNYRPEWLDEKFSSRMSLDVKAGEEGED